MYFCINSVLRTIFPAAEKIYDMKKIIILIVCVLSACFAAAQEPVPVLTLGTFHFDFPNLDQVQYAESEQIDVLNPVYQNEIETLVGLLEKFAPTIIVIERPVKMQFETDSLFRRYLADCYDLQRGEDEQIGFRLAKRLGIDRIYCVDEWGKHYDEMSYYAMKTVRSISVSKPVFTTIRILLKGLCPKLFSRSRELLPNLSS